MANYLLLALGLLFAGLEGGGMNIAARAALMSNGASGAFVPIEWMASDGNAYIITDIDVGGKNIFDIMPLSFEMDLRPPLDEEIVEGMAGGYLWGIKFRGTSSLPPCPRIQTNNSSKRIQITSAFGTASTHLVRADYQDKIFHIEYHAQFDDGTAQVHLNIDDITSTITVDSSSVSSNSKYYLLQGAKIPVFAMYAVANNIITYDSISRNGKLYSAKIIAAGITRDFIPVRVGSVGYMYDRVTGQLFGNQGTGNFILGPDI